MHGGQGTAVGAFLGLRGARAVGPFGAGEDAARGEEEDVAVGKLLFEFACEAGKEEGGGVSGGW